MKQKHIKILISLLLVSAVLAAGITFSYMYQKTETVTNEFTPGKVTCKVNETFEENAKSSISATNTGNIDAYIRIRLVSYFLNEKGQITAETSEIPAFPPAADWQSGGNDTYYYTKPVNPGEETTNLLSSPLILKEGQVIEVFAEAIQCSAAKSTWGVEFLNE